MTERELIITKLERDSEGFWRCRVSTEGCTWDIHRRYGSWMRDLEGRMQSVYPWVAARVQERVRKLEKQERQTA